MVKHVQRSTRTTARQPAGNLPGTADDAPNDFERRDDLEIVEQLLTLALEAITRKTPDVKMADVLKLLEFKHQLKPQADVRKVFWEWIERFRQETLAGDAAAPDTVPGLAPDHSPGSQPLVRGAEQ